MSVNTLYFTDANSICPILISNRNQIHTAEYEPDSEFDTWLRVLEVSKIFQFEPQVPQGSSYEQIDNELARNSLIISQGIDQTILVADRAEAISRMSGERLRNVRQCFSYNTKKGEGIRFGYGYGGALSESYIAAFRGTPRMKTDIEYQIT